MLKFKKGGVILLKSEVSIFRRFGAFIIDILIIAILNSIILRFIPYYNKMLEVYEQYYLEFMNNLNFSANDLKELSQAALIVYSINSGVMLILYFVYLVVLPFFWSKQTIGRAITRIKVVKKDDSKIKFTNLFLREIVGGFIVYNLLFYILALIINLILLTNNNRSIADYIGSTKLKFRDNYEFNDIDHDDSQEEKNEEYQVL